jgi:Cdc6-like AAA superfamily ATPase
MEESPFAVVDRLQAVLMERINSISFCNGQDEAAIRTKIADMQAQGTSNSLFIVGPIGSGKRGIVKRIVDTYIEKGRERSSTALAGEGSHSGLVDEGKLVATIRATSTISEGQALASIVNQFMYRDSIRKNPNIVLEDFKALLRVSHLCLYSFLRSYRVLPQLLIRLILSFAATTSGWHPCHHHHRKHRFIH